MRRSALVVLAAILTLASTAVPAQQKSPGAGPVVVLETSKGVIEFETYPEEAPKTVARILESFENAGWIDEATVTVDTGASTDVFTMDEFRSLDPPAEYARARFSDVRTSFMIPCRSGVSSCANSIRPSSLRTSEPRIGRSCSVSTARV